MSREKSDYANCISLFPHNVLHTMYGLREIAVPVSRDYDVYFPSPPPSSSSTAAQITTACQRHLRFRK